MRFEYAVRLSLTNADKVRSGKTVFQSRSKGMENIRFDGHFYHRKKINGTVEKFNRKGKLVKTTNSMGDFIKLEYKGSKLSYLIDNKGRRLNFSYNRSGKLNRIYNGRVIRPLMNFEVTIWLP